jgi:hypothetical protein
MRFVTRSEGHSVAKNLGVSDALLNLIPPDVQFSAVILGRIKGTGISMRGIEFMVMVTTPTEAIVYGRNGEIRWKKPLSGMTASRQALDSVRFVPTDGDGINFITGFPSRRRVIKHLVAAEENSRRQGGPEVARY